MARPPSSDKKRKAPAAGTSRRHRARPATGVQAHVTKGAIKRLARRGGVKRISALIYDETRAMLKAFLKRLLKDACLYCDYSRRKTVTAADVVRSMGNRGQRLYGFDDPPFPVSIRSSIKLTSDTPSTANTQSTETQSTISSAVDNTEGRTDENFSDSDATAENFEANSRRSARNLNASRSGDGTHRNLSHSEANEENLESNLRRSSRILNASHTGDGTDQNLSDSDATVENLEATFTAQNQKDLRSSRENIGIPVRKSRSDSDTVENCHAATVRSSDSNLPETAGDVAAATTPLRIEENSDSPRIVLERLEIENDASRSALSGDDCDYDPYSEDFGMTPGTPG